MRTEVKNLLQMNQGDAPIIKGTLLLTFKLIDGIKEMQRMIFTKNTLCLLMGIMLLHLAPVKALMEVFYGKYLQKRKCLLG